MHCPLYNIHRQQLVDSFNELNIEFTIQTILYGSETSDYNQNVKLFRAVHSFISLKCLKIKKNILMLYFGKEMSTGHNIAMANELIIL
jgi:seryl-tRNA synthetase